MLTASDLVLVASIRTMQILAELPYLLAVSGWLIAAVVIVLLAGVSWWLATRRKSSTVLKKATAERQGKTYIKRVYVERPGLMAKLWFEPNPEAPSAFLVGHRGDDDSFTVTLGAAEPMHIAEAREALLDVGLDFNKCTWLDIVEKAH